MLLQLHGASSTATQPFTLLTVLTTCILHWCSFESVCGFVNGVLLLAVAASVVWEAIHRMHDYDQTYIPSDPMYGKHRSHAYSANRCGSPCLLLCMVHVSTRSAPHRLLAVASGGLCINLWGLAYFHDRLHSSRGTEGCSIECCRSTPTYNEHGSGKSDLRGSNSNLRGVFLHILADTMGSLSAIVSTVLTHNFSWSLADPFCSLVVATCIMLAALPLLQESLMLLMLRNPAYMNTSSWQKCLALISAVPHVLRISHHKYWMHTHSKWCSAISVIAFRGSAPKERAMIAPRVSQILRAYGGMHHVTVEVEVEAD